MRVTRWISLAVVAVMALAAGIAVAHNGGGQAQKTEQVSATFNTKSVPDKTKTRQCTGVDGTYAITKGVDEGTVTGDPRLSGKITVKSKTVVNTTTGLGWTEGNAQTRDATTGKLKGVASFSAVITEGSKLEGYIVGKVKNPAPAASSTKAKGDHGHGREGKFNSELLANFSAKPNPDGSLDGGIGTGDGDNTAILHGNPCSPPQQPAGQNEDSGGGRHQGHGDNNNGDDHRGGRGGDDGQK